jgi:hypothetical protein
MKASIAAERIYATIEKHRASGLNKPRLLSLADVTPGQYRGAYNWTLDNFGEPIWVKNWIGREWIYRLTEDADAVAEDWKRTISTQVTRARREYHKIHMIAEEHPTVDNRLSAELARTRLEQLKIEKDRLR